MVLMPTQIPQTNGTTSNWSLDNRVRFNTDQQFQNQINELFGSGNANNIQSISFSPNFGSMANDGTGNTGSTGNSPSAQDIINMLQNTDYSNETALTQLQQLLNQASDKQKVLDILKALPEDMQKVALNRLAVEKEINGGHLTPQQALQALVDLFSLKKSGSNFSNAPTAGTPMGSFDQALTNNVPPQDFSNLPENMGGSATGNQIAAAGEQTAKAMGTTGWCAKGVSTALSKLGIQTTGHAKDLPQSLDKYTQGPNAKFRKISNLSKDQLGNLPKGAVVVLQPSGKDYTKGTRTYGHTYISDGKRGGWSDHYQANEAGRAHMYGRVDVYIPVDSSYKAA